MRGFSSIQHLAQPEQDNLARSRDYETTQSLPEMWERVQTRFAEIQAVYDPHNQPALCLTYRELYAGMQQFARGLQALGVQPQSSSAELPDRVALISDNCVRWLMADQGIMQAGGADVVRSAQAETQELLYILEHSGSIGLVVENLATYEKLRQGLNDLPLKFIVLLSDEAIPTDTPCQMLNFTQLMALGDHQTLVPAAHDRTTLATLMYTSGTSGMPKGVMLSHGNLLYQVQAAAGVCQPAPGERVMSILPIWHTYERTFEYFIFSRGCSQIYTNIRQVKKDLKEHKPHYMVAVPRLWESIYEGIQKQFRDQPPKQQKLVKTLLAASQRYVMARRTLQGLALDNLQPSPIEKLAAAVQLPVWWVLHKIGDRLVYTKIRAGVGGHIKFVVSGGGSIADHLEDFFEIVGIDILGGYGLTETSPITHVRRPWRNVRGADGQALADTQTRIVDPETRRDRAIGQKGLVLLRGPQIMQGYYKNPTATSKAIDPEGWFDTGDLGLLTAWGDLVITGRAKDTIVLTNGENIEPQPIENACLMSEYIDQVMLVGQDQKVLGALIVPNVDALGQWWTQSGYSGDVDLSAAAVQGLFKQELSALVKARPGYRADDRIGAFRLLSEPFSIENGLLTQTLKIRRNVVTDRYQAIIDEIFG